MAAALAERRFLAEVEHPNIVKIHNFVEHDGDGYIVMEYVNGSSLRGILEARREPPTAASPTRCRWNRRSPTCSRSCRRSGHLHDLGLLYCDFKPDNVIQTAGLAEAHRPRRRVPHGRPDEPGLRDGRLPGPRDRPTGPTVPSDLFTVARTWRCCAPTSAATRAPTGTPLPARDGRAALRPATTRSTASSSGPPRRTRTTASRAPTRWRRSSSASCARSSPTRRARPPPASSTLLHRRGAAGADAGPTGEPCPSRSSAPTTRRQPGRRRSAPIGPEALLEALEAVPQAAASRSTFDECVPSSSWGCSTRRPPCSTRWRRDGRIRPAHRLASAVVPRAGGPGRGGQRAAPADASSSCTGTFPASWRRGWPWPTPPRRPETTAAATAWYDIVSRTDPGYTRRPSAWPAARLALATAPVPSRPTSGSPRPPAPTIDGPASRRCRRCSTGRPRAGRTCPTSVVPRRSSTGSALDGEQRYRLSAADPRGGVRRTAPQRRLAPDPSTLVARASVHRPRPPARPRATYRRVARHAGTDRRADRARRPRQPHPAEVVVVSPRTLLRCPACGSSALADDEFCESCGAAIAGPRRCAAPPPRGRPRLGGGGDRPRARAPPQRGRLPHRGLRRRGGARGVRRRVGLDGPAGRGPGRGGGRRPIDERRAGRHRLFPAGNRAGSWPTHWPRRRRPWRACRGWSGARAGRAVVHDRRRLVGRRRRSPWPGPATAGPTGSDAAGCRRLTSDHSWAEEEVRAGRLSRAAAEADGRAHAITRWLGADASTQDFPVQTLRPANAGHLVLCTDGLWNYLPTRRRPGARDRRPLPATGRPRRQLVLWSGTRWPAAGTTT